MKLITLPPQKGPNQLTAHHPIKTLGEHALAFMNANNKGSWLEEHPEEVANLSTFLGGLLNQKEHTLKMLQTVCLVLRKDLTKQLKMHKTYDLLGRLLGYADWRDLREVMRDEQTVINRNFGKTINELSALWASAEGEVVSIPWNSFAFNDPAARFLKKIRPRIGSMRTYMQRFYPVIKELAEAVGGPRGEGWKEHGVNFSAFQCEDNPLEFWIIGEYHWREIIPLKDYSTFKVKITLYPVSNLIKSIGSVEVSEKSYTQWRFEYRAKHNQQ